MYTDKDALVGMKVFGGFWFVFGLTLIGACYFQIDLIGRLTIIQQLIQAEETRVVGVICVVLGFALVRSSVKIASNDVLIEQ